MAEKSVGLVVLTEVPGIGLVAVLRERGWYNFEKKAPESWPGVCQVTAHGGVKEGEDFINALAREIEEELGKDFLELIWRGLTGLSTVSRLEQGNKEIITYALKVGFGLLNRIRLAPDSGSIRFLKKDDIKSVIDATVLKKSNGSPSRSVIAMFPDEKEAVIAAFKHFEG